MSVTIAFYFFDRQKGRKRKVISAWATSARVPSAPETSDRATGPKSGTGMPWELEGGDPTSRPPHFWRWCMCVGSRLRQPPPPFGGSGGPKAWSRPATRTGAALRGRQIRGTTGGMAGRHPFSWPPSAAPTIAEDVKDLSIGGRRSEGSHRSDRSGVPARPPGAVVSPPPSRPTRSRPG